MWGRPARRAPDQPVRCPLKAEVAEELLVVRLRRGCVVPGLGTACLTVKGAPLAQLGPHLEPVFEAGGRSRVMGRANEVASLGGELEVRRGRRRVDLAELP
jgi:hypothetical protein